MRSKSATVRSGLVDRPSGPTSGRYTRGGHKESKVSLERRGGFFKESDLEPRYRLFKCAVGFIEVTLFFILCINQQLIIR